MIAVLEKMLEPDPDRRASSIAPLLTLLDGRSSPGGRRKGEPAPWEPEWRAELEREMQHWSSRYQRKYARREARREAHRARREARRRQRGVRVVPWPFSMVLALMFVVSIVLVSFATQLVVPLVLLALSAFFGRPMREAAEVVREAGRSAVEGLHRSRGWLRGEMVEQPNAPAPDAEDGRAPRPRVDPESRAPGDRVRVGAEPQPEIDEGEAAPGEDASWGDAERRARR
jgi:hypothetical protein